MVRARPSRCRLSAPFCVRLGRPERLALRADAPKSESSSKAAVASKSAMASGSCIGSNSPRQMLPRRQMVQTHSQPTHPMRAATMPAPPSSSNVASGDSSSSTSHHQPRAYAGVAAHLVEPAQALAQGSRALQRRQRQGRRQRSAREMR
eukprot:CAMPEP_0181230094 /NCGR_PEP_ID=MMETSP1096-20121128/34273_1 /TAXON_ID=156174 ORGANISM="Chrysochromulina ericina, Strain CCMP281" /NCGR_SAMPLE_ID=MMETSP1096 /ASSEMBLY_ACC=CAM_ASM_000453 /LENGTH=148 /DNA_ID=CAMNT_0023323813 /DNA_START=365 /DNA_END=809 /DNA_ORIENTATION=-